MLLGYSLYCFGNKLLVINLEAMTETFALFTTKLSRKKKWYFCQFLMIELLNNWPDKKFKPHICWRIGKDFRRNINSINMERHIERSSTFWRLFRPPNIIFRHVYLNQCVKTSILAFVVVKCVLFVPFLPAYLKLSLFLIMKCKIKIHQMSSIWAQYLEIFSVVLIRKVGEKKI